MGCLELRAYEKPWITVVEPTRMTGGMHRDNIELNDRRDKRSVSARSWIVVK